MSNFDELYDTIIQHQKLMKKYPLAMEARVPYVRDLVLATHVELTEFLTELPWKPWKPTDQQTSNTYAALHELCDVFIFLLDIAVAMGFESKGLVQGIQNKVNINVARLESGQHQPHK